jgi:hypothetical protein
LQYLLTGIFVSPGLTLKKIYSGGLTVMKVGTVSKITVGAAALIAVIFIGYMGVRQMNAPTVEERVYLSPWEDGTLRPRNSSEQLIPQTDSTQGTESQDNQPQIASAASAEGRELIDDLFAELNETDLSQFATEVDFDLDAEESLTADTSMLLDDAGQSAEDVMNEFVEALRNADFEAIRQLLTADMRRGLPDDSEIPIEIREVRHEVDGVVQATAEEEIRQLEPEMVEFFREALSQSSVVSSEYVDDEFHFLLRMLAPPAPRIPKIPDNGERGVEIVDISVSVTSPPDSLIKMRKEEGVWRVYEGPMLE